MNNKNTCLTLSPALALVSKNITFNWFAFLSPSSVDTCLSSAKSVLLPTKTTKWLIKLNQTNKILPSIIRTSLPRSSRTSSIHFEVCWNEFESKYRHTVFQYFIIYTCYIINNNSKSGITYITWNKASEKKTNHNNNILL